MDPISIAAAVVGVSRAVTSVVTTLSGLQAQYKGANLTVGAICSESSAVQVVLSQIEGLRRRDDGRVITERLERQPALTSAFDTSITGCMMLYTCFETEIVKLRDASKRGRLTWTRKTEVMWKQDTMSGLLERPRGQVLVLNTLLQGLQMRVAWLASNGGALILSGRDSLLDVRDLLAKQSALLGQIQHDTGYLRREYPQATVPDSIIDDIRSADTIFGNAESVVGDEEFSFDNAVANSKAYRAVLSKVHEHSCGNTRPSGSQTGALLLRRSSRSGKLSSSQVLAWQADRYSRNFMLGLTDLTGSLCSHYLLSTVWNILKSEGEFIKLLAGLLRLHRDELLNASPEIVKRGHNFVDKVFGGLVALRELHERELYLPLLSHWKREGSQASFDYSLFADFLDAAKPVYADLANTWVSGTITVQRELGFHSNTALQDHLKQSQEHLWSAGRSWQEVLELPHTRLKTIRALFQALKEFAPLDDVSESLSALDQSISSFSDITLPAESLVSHMLNVANVLEEDMYAELDLSSPCRRISGTMITKLCRVELPGAFSPWDWYRVTAFDNGILFATIEGRTDWPLAALGYIAILAKRMGGPFLLEKRITNGLFTKQNNVHQRGRKLYPLKVPHAYRASAPGKARMVASVWIGCESLEDRIECKRELEKAMGMELCNVSDQDDSSDGGDTSSKEDGGGGGARWARSAVCAILEGAATGAVAEGLRATFVPG